MADEQLDYGDREYAGAQKMQFQGGGAIAALVDDEIIGEDDEYDDLYNDVNVGDGFLQHHNADAPPPSAGAGTGGFQVQRAGMLEPRANNATQPQQLNVQPMMGTTDKGGVNGMNHGAQMSNPNFQGSAPMPQKPVVGPTLTGTGMAVKLSAEPVPLPNSGSNDPRSVQQMPANQMAMNVNANVNRPMANENQVRPALENGGTMLFVGELHWWTTDAELESVLSQYGRVKEIKFFDERASGKSKGYCQVEFYESAAAASCKEGMDGHVFNGRPCVVAFASPQTMRQMANSYASKTANQTQSQQPQGRRPMNDGMGRGGGAMNQQGGDGGRGFGRGGWGGRGGQGILNRGPGDGHMRGRGGPMGGRNNMMGNFNGGNGGGAFGQGLPGPGFGGPPGGLMHPQGMMGGGFDPSYMGRGGGYGGFSGPPFPGMMPQFPGVNPMGLAGVAPHVNPAFFGRGMVPNGMGMMGPTGMEGPHGGGMWADTSMGGWAGDEQGQRTRESSYGGEDGGSEYGYGEAGGREKAAKPNAASKEKERGHERDWSGNSEKRNRDEREPERDRSDRDHHRYREEKDGYREHHRQRERDADYEDDWDRGQSSRSRSRSKAIPEEDYRRSRDSDYGKRRRLPSE